LRKRVPLEGPELHDYERRKKLEEQEKLHKKTEKKIQHDSDSEDSDEEFAANAFSMGHDVTSAQFAESGYVEISEKILKGRVDSNIQFILLKKNMEFSMNMARLFLWVIFRSRKMREFPVKKIRFYNRVEGLCLTEKFRRKKKKQMLWKSTKMSRKNSQPRRFPRKFR
jgi:hypothetical protein